MSDDAVSIKILYYRDKPHILSISSKRKIENQTTKYSFRYQSEGPNNVYFRFSNGWTILKLTSVKVKL